MDEYEKNIRRKLRDDFEHYAKKCLKIRTKGGSIEPFILNKPQRYIHECVENQRRETGRIRAIILKGRQEGCSTYVEGRFYWRVTHRFGVRAFILTHDNDATNNLFEMANRYHQHCSAVVRPTIEASNAKELIFAGLDSGYKLGTAGNKSVGRSSTIQYLHGSEVAYWPNASEHAKGIMQAVPDVDGTEIFLESTANGIGNYFHQQWQLAEVGLSGFIPIFIPWFWQEEYTKFAPKDFTLTEEEQHLADIYQLNDQQLCWRRHKINSLSADGFDGLLAFRQEYPCSPREAFVMSDSNSFIPSAIVEKARKCDVKPVGRLIIGIDSATSGNDRTAIIRRHGRKIYKLQTFIKKSPTELANIIHRIIEEEKPDLVVLDGAPAGGGAEIRDRLYDIKIEYKDFVKTVLGGQEPLNKNLYFNKRAEMWGTMKLGLLDYPCEIPDNDELEADLCNIQLDHNDHLGRIKLEAKDKMKKRGIRSPDCGDALAYTYAFPETAFMRKDGRNDKALAKNLMSGFNNIDRLKKAAYGK
jgi:hypothetical protein